MTDYMAAAIKLTGPVVPSAPLEEAPPPYTTLPREPAEAGAAGAWAGRGSAAPHAGYNPRGVKLGHVDFVPRCVRKRLFKDDIYETFDMLVQRANTWLEDHQGITLMSCETVTWTGLKTKKIFSDAVMFAKSMNASKDTKCIRGLRSRSPVIETRTFVPNAGERFDQLLSRVNDRLAQDRLGGSILSIETIKVLSEYGDQQYNPGYVHPGHCFWREYPDDKKMYVLCLRVYAVLSETQSHETIGYKDFIPEHNQRNQENGGYEVFGDIMQRASRWVAGQRGVRFCSIQALNVKYKKTSAEPTRLTYRTFTPAQITAATTDSAPEYEGMRSLLDRVNQWLQITGARCFYFETLPIRCVAGPLQMLGAEATFTQNRLQPHNYDMWLYHIRLYLTGEYIEPPGAVSLVVPSVSVITQI